MPLYASAIEYAQRLIPPKLYDLIIVDPAHPRHRNWLFPSEIPTSSLVRIDLQLTQVCYSEMSWSDDQEQKAFIMKKLGEMKKREAVPSERAAESQVNRVELLI